MRLIYRPLRLVEIWLVERVWRGLQVSRLLLYAAPQRQYQLGGPSCTGVPIPIYAFHAYGKFTTAPHRITTVMTMVGLVPFGPISSSLLGFHLRASYSD